MEIEPYVDAQTAADFVHLRRRHLLELARAGLIRAHPAPSLGDGERNVWLFRLSEIAEDLAARTIKCGDAAVRTGKGKH